MISVPSFLKVLLGAAIAIAPIQVDAKPKKERGKQRSSMKGEVRKKESKSPQRSAKAVGQRKRNVARSEVRRQTSKTSRPRIKSSNSPRRYASPSVKRTKPSGIRKADRFAESKPSTTRKNEQRKARQNEIAAIDKAPRVDRDAGSERSRRNLERTARETNRREKRVETAEERDRRAKRTAERQRISQTRKQQINERQERRRDRVERFRENRPRRFAAVQRQRRALWAARAEARREYREEVREEIQEYWEDRADEVRDRIRDRHDDLFDDDWWEHRHWHHGPILVSSPWWWWRPARWGSINVFLGGGWSEPYAYDYGTDVIYDQDIVYVRGEPVGTPIEYSNTVIELANPPLEAVAEAPIDDVSWSPLGVWALAQEEQGEAVMFFQLSVNRDGVISGAYSNVMSGEELPIVGRVDRKTQRAAWHIGEEKEKVFEAGMANLTQDQASCLVHLGKGEMQNWLLVRLESPEMPDHPTKLSHVAE